MKNLLFLFIAFVMASQVANAQCTTCTPMFVNTCPAAGGLCDKLDTAYANHPYNKVLNFYMPKILTDPSILSQCSCNTVDLITIRVTGVSGLPTGINYLISNNGTFHVANNDTLGCATFCGTPLLPGTYVVHVYLSADVTAIGTPIGNVNQNNNAESYTDTLWVLPDTTAGVSSFTYGNNGFSACDSITIDLNALYSAPQPNLTRYFWNVAGQTTEAKSPGVFKFTNTSSVPDTFPVTLTTIFYNYTVKNVHIANITGGYCGDIEEVACGCVGSVSSPDPYIEFPLIGFNNSSNYVSNQCTNVNFTNINASIPLGTQTLSMQMWDKDNGPPFGSADDLIGTYSLNVLLGQYNFSNNNADGYVEFDTIEGTTVTETLNVIVNPTPRIPYVVASKDTFCSGDSVFVAIDTASYYPGCTFAWYRDTVFLTAQADTGFYTSTPGKYKVTVTNALTGCNSTSAFKKVAEGQSPPSSAYIVFTGTQEYINPLPSAFSADWYFNGVLVTGHHGAILPFLGNGAYSAEIYNTNFPQCRTMLATDSVTNVGINEITGKVVYNINVLPNPNNGNFMLQFSSPTAQHLTLTVRNVIGEAVYNKDLQSFSGDFSEEINLSNMSKGVYVVTVESANGRENRKIVVQ